MCLCSQIWKLKREEAARINLALRTQEVRLNESFNIPVATDFMAMFDSLAAKRRTLGCKAQNKLCRKSAPKCANFSLILAPTIAIFLLVATPIVPNFGAADGFTASMLQYVHARWIDWCLISPAAISASLYAAKYGILTCCSRLRPASLCYYNLNIPYTLHLAIDGTLSIPSAPQYIRVPARRCFLPLVNRRSHMSLIIP